MKAKEYADWHLNKGGTIIDIGTAFVKETFQLIKDRKCKTDSAHVAVLREQNDKWRAFAKLTNFDEKGYEFIVKRFSPELHSAWMNYNAAQLAKKQFYKEFLS